jgi:hypothetical protein
LSNWNCRQSLRQGLLLVDSCPIAHKVVWTPAFSGGHDATGRALRGGKLLRRDQANEDALSEPNMTR